MLTARGWWVLVAAWVLAVAGVSAGVATIALLGLTLCTWFGLLWLVFIIRSRVQLPKVQAHRHYTIHGREVHTVWAGASVDVITQIESKPIGVLEVRGVGRGTGVFSQSLTLSEPGRLESSGIATILHDPHGFFRAERFIESPSLLTVLPPHADDDSRQRSAKRFNVLPPPGTHRLRMPGSGSELLDLRDYRPGDPPKMIAWKASARRDRLITKEFESDVPVRCVLFLDASNSVRVGEPQLVNAAAGILLGATANRDLVGLTTFDALAFQRIAPGRSSPHVQKTLVELSRVASLLPDVPDSDPDRVMAHLNEHLRPRYPELFENRLNTRPLGMFWRPLLDRRFGWLIAIPFLLGLLLPLLFGMAWLEFAARTARGFNRLTPNVWLNLGLFLVAFLGLLSLPSVLGTMFWLSHGLLGYLPSNRRRVGQRKQAAAVFAVLDNDAGAIERILKDDDALAARAGMYLQAEYIRVPVRRWDRRGRDRLREPAKIEVLSLAMIRAVRRARDNELFVILLDAIDLAEALTPLGRAIKLARTRHHQVLVVLHWPSAYSERNAGGDVFAHVEHTRQRLAENRFETVRRRLGKAGGSVIRYSKGDTVRTVVAALDRLRGARSRA